MMHANLSFKVNVSPLALITALQANKTRHLEEYRVAIQEYFKDLDETISALHTRVRDKDLSRPYHINLQPPVNNEKLYDKYIGMLRMSKDELIELSAEDYGCMVDDNWDWSISARILNATYTSKAGSRR